MKTSITSFSRNRQALLAGAAFVGVSLVGGCTGDAALDTSLASIVGGLAAAATGDYSAAQELASISQHAYSQAQTGAYRYDAETVSVTGPGGTLAETESVAGPGGTLAETASVSPSFGAGNSPVDAAALSVAAQDYGASMHDLGERIDMARSALGTTCPTDLGYVEPALPRFSDPELEELRSTVVTASVEDTLAEQKAMGWRHDQTAIALMDTYNQSVQLVDEAVQTFRATTGGDPEPLLVEIRNGTYPILPSQEGGVQGNSARAIVMGWYMMVAAQEMALAIACHGAAS